MNNTRFDYEYLFRDIGKEPREIREKPKNLLLIKGLTGLALLIRVSSRVKIYIDTFG